MKLLGDDLRIATTKIKIKNSKEVVSYLSFFQPEIIFLIIHTDLIQKDTKGEEEEIDKLAGEKSSKKNSEVEEYLDELFRPKQ